MSLKFLPKQSNKINSMGAIGFNAYYDKTISDPFEVQKWRSTGENSNFLIQHRIYENIEGKSSLNIYADEAVPEEEVIEFSDNKAIGIDKEGYISSGNGILTKSLHITFGSEFILNKWNNNTDILFSPTEDFKIELPFNDDEIPIGWGCYLTKDGQILNSIKVYIEVRSSFRIHTGYRYDTALFNFPSSSSWLHGNPNRPLLMPDEKIYLYKIDTKEWLLGFGTINILNI